MTGPFGWCMTIGVKELVTSLEGLPFSRAKYREAITVCQIGDGEVIEFSFSGSDSTEFGLVCQG